MDTTKAKRMGTREMALTIDVMNDTICELKAANIELSKEIANQQKREDFAVKEMARLRKMYNEQEDELVELKEEYRSACDCNRAHLTQIGNLQAQIDRQAALISEQTLDLSIKNEALTDTDTQLRHYHMINEQIARELDLVKQSHADMTSACNARSTAIKDLESKLEAMNSEVETQRNVATHNLKLLEMCKRRADDYLRYKQFYALLHGLLHGEGEEE